MGIRSTFGARTSPMATTPKHITIRGARTHNLKDVSLAIPHNTFVVVTGISGSGKSSLVFDIVAGEGQRRYLETLPSFAVQFAGKLTRPEVEAVEGLSPVIAIGQHTSGAHVRSTVGTLSDVYGMLRLLFARRGETDRDIELSRSLFSFNTATGKCPTCNGIGQQEEISLDKLIADPTKTLREGALAPTLPTGYIMYSQVTIDVLNQVCEAEGFSVDIPWNELTSGQQQVVLYGSEKIKVPFGKHSLESRLKWSGIKAKPREEGHYRGMLPIMSDILRRDRNANILKYVHAVTCPSCGGARLNQDARSVTVHGQAIHALASLELYALKDWLEAQAWDPAGQAIVDRIVRDVQLFDELGLGHLSLSRPAHTLSPSEVQRIRVANQLSVPLSNVLYVLDEPSIGLSREENRNIIRKLRELVQRGNTVVVVEHNLDTIRHADHLIDMGPEAGVHGGEVLYNGPFSDFLNQSELQDRSATYRALTVPASTPSSNALSHAKGKLELLGCTQHNLKDIDVTFQLGGLNVVSGRSGAGKSSLVLQTLMPAVQQHLGQALEAPLRLTGHRGMEAIDKLVFIDHTPIGKTPRSNPATYLGLSDPIRDLLAGTEEAKARKFTKSRFSFNNKGGRCETCQGAGKTQLGMHFLGKVDLVCDTCGGKRFNDQTLEVRFEGKTIADIYELSVDQALDFFANYPKVLKGLRVLKELGLGYLTLGQSSTTLSGGEAQRVKIANQLQKTDTGDTLYIVVEPSIGLHHANIHQLLDMFDAITAKGNTVVCIEQSAAILQHAHWHIELGPCSGSAGGEVEHMGPPREIPRPVEDLPAQTAPEKSLETIVLKGVSTHGLKQVDVCFPKEKLTVVTGVSGSGKSSLAFDTLFAESHARFTESLSAHSRTFIQQSNPAKLKSASGLGPAVGVQRRVGQLSKRSTVGTLSGVYDVLRLIYSRIAQEEGSSYTAQHFSFNHHLGACTTCGGLGYELKADPDLIITDPTRSVLDGACSSNKAVKYYADPGGQFMATLRAVAAAKDWNLDMPWNGLADEVKHTVLYGTGDQMWDVEWEFTTKGRTGIQSLQAKWEGLCNYIQDEYERRLHNKNIGHLEELMRLETCNTCKGTRLKSELLAFEFLGKPISAFADLPVSRALAELHAMAEPGTAFMQALTTQAVPRMVRSLQTLDDLGLGHLSLSRSGSTLSGGELQRVVLANQLAAHLCGVTYVLDEPTIGLDAGQVRVLTGLLKSLCANGNTVVVVEHDKALVAAADHIVEMGPVAGAGGGQVVFEGSVEAVSQVPETQTYALLNAPAMAPLEVDASAGSSFGLRGAHANNLKQIDVSWTSRRLLAVTGVSGSGKSSLVRDALFASWTKGRPVGCDEVFGLDQFSEVVLMDQQPFQANRSTTPASFTGVLKDLQTLFANTEEAKAFGLKKTHFSYLHKNGRCTTCGGHGQLKTSLDFMSDVWVPCDTCHGQRYHQDALQVRVADHTIGEFLQLSIKQALVLLDGTKAAPQLDLLQRLGLGHLQLGQGVHTLSGGEGQRLKLASHVLGPKDPNVLYLLDEPTAGLHVSDVQRLVQVFDSWIADGATVLVIEHGGLLADCASEIVHLGPGAGDAGGWVV